MDLSCPAAPLSVARPAVALTSLRQGTVLVRFHSPARAVLAFNPNKRANGTWTSMAIATDGARFNPFPADSGGNVSTLYAGDDEHAAALESVFHDVDHRPNPTYPTSKLQAFVMSRFEVQRDLVTLRLVNDQLRQVPVPDRGWSLQEAELIHTRANQYPFTRQWAQQFYLAIPDLQGLAWRPRLGGTGTAYVLFGDRIDPADLAPLGSPTRIDTGPGRTLIETIAHAAHIDLVTT